MVLSQPAHLSASVVVVVLILLVLLLRRRRKDKLLLEVDAADDIRENVVFYDEEGAGEALGQHSFEVCVVCYTRDAHAHFSAAGEEDMQGYDISRLQIPMGGDADSMIKGPPIDEPMMYRRDMVPVGGGS